MSIRLLRADEIDVRVQSISKEDKGAVLLLYKDARVDMNILDETFGPENWQRNHEVINGNLFCNVGVKVKGEWVWKQDVGVESYAEKEKGQASDSFKRACFNWGIGRELYTGPFVWIPNMDDMKGGKCYTKFKVREISYNDKREIVSLVIVDDKNRTRYTYKGLTEGPVPNIVTPIISQGTKSLEGSKCSQCGEVVTLTVKNYSTKNYGKALCMDCQKKSR